MANNKKYLEVLNNGDEDLYVYDGEAREQTLHPVNVETLTPSSTFVKNAIIGINGVLYRSTQATSNFPVTLTISDGQFVTHTVNNKTAFVVSDFTINTGWEIWTDAGVEYWVSQMEARLTAIEGALNGVLQGITVDGTTYTAADVITAIAQFMGQSLVTTTN